MRYIGLRAISNRAANSSMSDRLLCYELGGPAGSRTLTAHLHVTYHFPHEEDWAPGGRGRWKQAFKSHAENTWSLRYDLISPGGYFSGDARVSVRLRVHEVAAGTVHRDRHWWVAVNSPARHVREWLTSTMYRVNGPLPHSTLVGGGSGMIKVHCRDVECGWLHGVESGNSMTEQRGTDHEVGHMLGIQHPYCNGGHVDEGDVDSASCYWRPGEYRGRSAASYSLMGLGNQVAPSDYVWAKKLVEQVDGRPYRLQARQGLPATCAP